MKNRWNIELENRLLTSRRAFVSGATVLAAAPSAIDAQTVQAGARPIPRGQHTTPQSSGSGRDNSDLAQLIFRQDGNSMVIRPVVDKLRDVSLTPRDAGVNGNNDPADANKLQKLFDESPVGGSIFFPVGAYKSIGKSFSLRRKTAFRFAEGAMLRSDQRAGQRFNALNINIMMTDGDTVPGTNGEARGMVLSGGRIFTNHVGKAGSIAAGGYGLAINTDSAGKFKSIIGMTIRDMSLAGGHGALAIGSNASSSSQWIALERCTLINGTLFNAEDGEVAINCISGGQNTGFTFDLTYGAYCCGVIGGTIANSGGAVDIVNGSFIQIDRVQIEHGNRSAANGLIRQSHIAIRGRNYASQGCKITDCNFGGSRLRIGSAISLYNARHTSIEDCQFAPSKSSDLYLDVDKSSSGRDAYDTIIGYGLNYRGARPVQPAGKHTDVQRRMIIATGAPLLRQPQRGMWYPGFRYLTDKIEGLEDDGFEFMIEHSGLMAFQGGMILTSGFVSGTQIAALPLWIMPHRDQYVPIWSQTGQGIGKLEVATGKLFLNSNLRNPDGTTATWLRIANAAWHALVNPGYDAPA